MSGPPTVAQVEFPELQHEDVDEQNMERGQSMEVDEIVEDDTDYLRMPIPPIDFAPPDIATWPLTSSSNQQDAMDYESLYEDIEDSAIQPEEQAGNYIFSVISKH